MHVFEGYENGMLNIIISFGDVFVRPHEFLLTFFNIPIFHTALFKIESCAHVLISIQTPSLGHR